MNRRSASVERAGAVIMAIGGSVGGILWLVDGTGEGGLMDVAALVLFFGAALWTVGVVFRR